MQGAVSGTHMPALVSQIPYDFAFTFDIFKAIFRYKDRKVSIYFVFKKRQNRKGWNLPSAHIVWIRSPGASSHVWRGMVKGRHFVHAQRLPLLLLLVCSSAKPRHWKEIPGLSSDDALGKVRASLSMSQRDLCLPHCCCHPGGILVPSLAACLLHHWAPTEFGKSQGIPVCQVAAWLPTLWGEEAKLQCFEERPGCCWVWWELPSCQCLY